MAVNKTLPNRIRRENDVYGAETVHLNGTGLRAPAWPLANSTNEKMFLIPSVLKEGDQINITGLITSEPQWVSISLVTEHYGPNGSKEPDKNNIASQMELYFPSNDSSEQKIVVKTILNGDAEEVTASVTPWELFPDLPSSTSIPVTVSLTMVVSRNGYGVEFYINDSYVDKIQLKHRFDDIRYMILNGDVEKVNRLEFQFA